jgi:hypothetical protein
MASAAGKTPPAPLFQGARPLSESLSESLSTSLSACNSAPRHSLTESLIPAISHRHLSESSIRAICSSGPHSESRGDPGRLCGTRKHSRTSRSLGNASGSAERAGGACRVSSDTIGRGGTEGQSLWRLHGVSAERAGGGFSSRATPPLSHLSPPPTSRANAIACACARPVA